MKHGRRWLAGSAVVLVLAVAGIVTRGLDLGVEFTGGRLVEYSTTAPLSVDDARAGGLGRRLPAGRRAGERGRQHLGAHR